MDKRTLKVAGLLAVLLIAACNRNDSTEQGAPGASQQGPTPPPALTDSTYVVPDSLLGNNSDGVPRYFAVDGMELKPQKVQTPSSIALSALNKRPYRVLRTNKDISEVLPGADTTKIDLEKEILLLVGIPEENSDKLYFYNGGTDVRVALMDSRPVTAVAVYRIPTVPSVRMLVSKSEPQETAKD